MRKVSVWMVLAWAGLLSGQEAGKLIKADAGFDAIVPAGAKIEKLAGGLVFTEGPQSATSPGAHRSSEAIKLVKP